MTDIDTWEWFGNRTFHHSQFELPAKLREAKERLGLSVSVCLPTRDEAATVGGIVKNLRRNLVERAEAARAGVLQGGRVGGLAATAAQDHVVKGLVGHGGRRPPGLVVGRRRAAVTQPLGASSLATVARPEVAPSSSGGGCRGFVGPVPPPLWMRRRMKLWIPACPGTLLGCNTGGA